MSDQSPNIEAHLEEDVAIAARTRLPVLITATPDRAFAIVRAIADRSGATGLVALHIRDSAAGGAILAGLTDDWLRATAAAGITLVLQEVQNLSRIEQTRLYEILDGHLSWSDDAAPRLITTSSVSLFDQVRQDTFDARLFNRLNVIHIMLLPYVPLPRSRVAVTVN